MDEMEMEDMDLDSYDVRFRAQFLYRWQHFSFYLQFNSPSRRARRKKRGWDSSKLKCKKLMYGVYYIEIDTP